MVLDKKRAAAEFAATWIGKGDEKQDTQRFWIDLFQSVFGVKNPTKHLLFEKRVRLEESTRYIDVYIPDTKVLIEQKGMNIDLAKPELQSGGASLTPYNQARRYDNNLPIDEKARWIICCNFQRFEIHDMKNPLAEPDVILLSDFEKNFQKLSFIADINVDHVRNEEQISVKAGQLVGKLYDAILPQYEDANNEESLKSLNQLCVRLVFCLYAEDTGLFGEKDKFYSYLSSFKTGQFRKGLIELFKVFDTPYEERDKYMDPELAAFPYIKGGIFTDDIEIPQFTDNIIDLLLNKASLEVDWSEISPTVFGAVFESTLNPETRHSGGMHYTSVENIHKVIDPLFLDELKQELNAVLSIPVKSKREKALIEYQKKLSMLKFLDPACGSGNFLTETYLSIRRLENQVLIALGKEGMLWLGEEFSPIKVKISQFYGIEINDFAVSVARTALWIAESQTMKETEHIVGRPIEYFPLKENPNIVEANALRIDWNEVVPVTELNYIMGNPPFVGAMWSKGSQREDIQFVFPESPKTGQIDYVAGWYAKAAKLIKNTNVRCAFVSTNSICQGQQVALIWEPLIKLYQIKFDFAYRTFRWDSEANTKAQVHCIIIGFSHENVQTVKVIYSDCGKSIVEHINGYLTPGKDIFIMSRNDQISGMPTMHMGVMARDGGNLIMDEVEYQEYIANEPQGKEFIHPYMMGREFLNNVPRYCFWLVGANPTILKKCPILLERIERVRMNRLQSPAKETQKLAETPTLFAQLNQPKGNFIAFPKVSSERRRYIPIGFLNEDVIVGDKLYVVENVGLYHFGVLTSEIHNSWMRLVAGRMKSDYSYSNTIVYNNFPWPSPTQQQIEKIESTAQAILNARNLYPECSLADLYDHITMPVELKKAHTANDKAVMEAYGFKYNMPEDEIVAELFSLYMKLSKQ